MRVLRKGQVKDKSGLSFATIDRKERAGEFPARIQLGNRAIGWLEGEVDAWIEKRLAERDARVA
jgi:prophage regulatory protein